MQEQVWEAASYLVAIFGSILLWVSYALFGMIARRYRQVFNRATYSTLLMAAPTGLLIYTIFLVFKATPLLDDPKLAELAQWVAYIALLASGFLCLVATAKFSSVLSFVTKPQSVSEPKGE
jgi:hypothetical protein